MSLLDVKNIRKIEDSNIILDDISFSIEEKGIYAILGKKSSGKTALAQVIAGCSEIDDGEVVFRDVSVYSNTKNNVAAKLKIGYVPSECNFFEDMTIFETLDFVGRLRHVEAEKRIRQIKQALEMVDLSSKYEVFVKELSKSEKKRLALANALIGNPSLIVLDNPISQISLKDAELIKNVILMLGDKKTVILLTDSVSLADSVADNIGIIANGKLSVWESKDSLKSRYPEDDNYLVKTFSTFSADN